MRALFVRHGIAEDGLNVATDMDRRLTDEGRARCRAVFEALADYYETLDLVVCSEAVRARETAEILATAFDGVSVEVNGLLNCGAGYGEFQKLVRKTGFEHDSIAFVGHQPDFSRIVAGIVGDGKMRIDVKKASCIEVDMNSLCKGELKVCAPPSFILNLKKN